jgi:hypothetical protein
MNRWSTEQQTQLMRWAAKTGGSRFARDLLIEVSMNDYAYMSLEDVMEMWGLTPESVQFPDSDTVADFKCLEDTYRNAERPPLPGLRAFHSVVMDDLDLQFALGCPDTCLSNLASMCDCVLLADYETQAEKNLQVECAHRLHAYDHVLFHWALGEWLGWGDGSEVWDQLDNAWTALRLPETCRPPKL